MSRKQQPKDPSCFVFDARSGAVRAQGGASENMREKVQAVRAVVPNRSNTEIVLVLQHFDNAVDRAVQAFMEGNASEVLKEWTVTGKKKNKKKKAKAKAQPGPGQEEKAEKAEKNWEKLEKLGISINGFHGNRSPSLESLPEPGTGLEKGTEAAPDPTPSGARTPGGRKLGPSLERSLKDLQRCSVALARFRALLRDEVENSLRRVRGAFTDIQACLMDREVALLAEMDKVKAEAMDLLSLRQRRAEALRALTEAAPAMSEEQLQELRADIKHFVSERKFDEELGRAGRFGCDLEALRGSIGAFGQGPAIPAAPAAAPAPDPRDQLRDRLRDHPRHSQRDQLRDLPREPRNSHRDQLQDQLQDQPWDQFWDQLQDQPREPQNSHRDQPQDPPRAARPQRSHPRPHSPPSGSGNLREQPDPAPPPSAPRGPPKTPKKTPKTPKKTPKTPKKTPNPPEPPGAARGPAGAAPRGPIPETPKIGDGDLGSPNPGKVYSSHWCHFPFFPIFFPFFSHFFPIFPHFFPIFSQIFLHFFPIFFPIFPLSPPVFPTGIFGVWFYPNPGIFFPSPKSPKFKKKFPKNSQKIPKIPSPASRGQRGKSRDGNGGKFGILGGKFGILGGKFGILGSLEFGMFPEGFGGGPFLPDLPPPQKNLGIFPLEFGIFLFGISPSNFGIFSPQNLGFFPSEFGNFPVWDFPPKFGNFPFGIWDFPPEFGIFLLFGIFPLKFGISLWNFSLEFGIFPKKFGISHLGFSCYLGFPPQNLGFPPQILGFLFGIWDFPLWNCSSPSPTTLQHFWDFLWNLFQEFPPLPPSPNPNPSPEFLGILGGSQYFPFSTFFFPTFFQFLGFFGNFLGIFFPPVNKNLGTNPIKTLEL